MKTVMIKIKENTKTELLILKAKLNLKSIDEVIQLLLKKPPSL